MTNEPTPEKQDLSDFLWRSELPLRKRMRDALRDLHAVQRDARYQLTYMAREEPVHALDARYLVFVRLPDEQDPDNPDPEGNSTVSAGMTDDQLE